MAHIKKLSNGRYKAIVEMGKSPSTGKRKRRTKTFDRKKDAQTWVGEKITERETGTDVDPSKVTVAEFLDRWLNNHKKPKVEATTYDRYKNKINAHLKPGLGGIPIQDLEPYHVESYFAKKRVSGRKDNKEGGLSENTLKKHYVILNNAMKRALKLKLIKYNPVQAVESPQPEDYEAPVMRKEEYHKLLNEIKDDALMFAFVMTDLMTGMRRSEILGLEWSEVDLEEGVIEVKKRLVTVEGGTLHENKTKNDSSKRKIKISEKLISILKKYKNEQNKMKLKATKYDKSKNFVFCRPDGKHYAPKTFNNKLDKYLEQAGLTQEYTIHTLRHTFATLNLEHGVPAKIVQEMLGHSTISTTLDIYSHVDLDMQQEAVGKLEKAINIE